MSKLYFRYGAMNSGKSTALIQVAHNYEERGQAVILAKPATDLKAGRSIESRLGVSREVDLLITPKMNLRTEFNAMRNQRQQDPAVDIACLLLDEAQFFTRDQINEAMEIAVLDGIPALAYGIRTDFITHGFPGSIRLLEIAHTLEELKTICRCGRKAMFNGRKADGKFVFQGDQVAIDGIEVTYESLCATCFLKENPNHTFE
jgi:thymidine kinase